MYILTCEEVPGAFGLVYISIQSNQRRNQTHNLLQDEENTG
jgi:hypothetical protein